MGKIIKHYIMPHPPIVIPEIGRGEERKIEATFNACGSIGEEIADLKPKTIIIVTPHGPVFRDAIALSEVQYISGDLSKFGAPQVKMNIKINQDLTRKINEEAFREGLPTAMITENSQRDYRISMDLDHGSMVPLYFINNHYKDYQLVHITYGILSPIDLYKFGIVIKRAVELSDMDAVFIASGDLSHKLSSEGPYGYNPYGQHFDLGITSLLEQGAVLNIFNMDKHMIEEAGECGMRSFYMLLGTLDGYMFEGELLSYEGTFGVGYGVMKLNSRPGENRHFLKALIESKQKETEERKQNEDPYVKLARKSLEHYIIEGEAMPLPGDLPEELLKERRGVFVSLKKDGELRGCIGTILPVTASIAEEIMRNAIEAGEHDPRFFPVEEEELEDIVYSVDVLTEPTKATREELNPKRYGVIVSKGRRAGLLLPDLEGVDTVDHQLEIALQKAGISPNEDFEIEKFEVIRHR